MNLSTYLVSLRELVLGNSPLVYIIVFIVGFVASLNPHMLGMIPMYLGIMAKDNRKKVNWKELLLFALSFSLILTILGVAVASLGASMHPIMQMSYIIAGLIYLLLGLKLLGIDWRKLSPVKIIFFYSKSNSKKSFLKNLILPLVFTPCSLPYIISILTLAMVRGKLLYGGMLLFSFGLGHSLIFIISGIFSGVLSKIEISTRYKKIVNISFALFMMIMGIVFLIISRSHGGHHM